MFEILLTIIKCAYILFSFYLLMERVEIPEDGSVEKVLDTMW